MRVSEETWFYSLFTFSSLEVTWLDQEVTASDMVAQGDENQWDSALYTDMERPVVFLTVEMALAYQETLDNSYNFFPRRLES